MKENELKTTYKTTDIYLATALIVCGAELLDFEETRNIKKQIVFVLSVPNIDWEKIVDDYINDKLKIKARNFVETFKALRSKMFIKLNSY